MKEGFTYQLFFSFELLAFSTPAENYYPARLYFLFTFRS